MKTVALIAAMSTQLFVALVATLLNTTLLHATSLNTAMLNATEATPGASENAWSAREIEGWRVSISKQLERDDPKALAAALELLSSQLQEIVRVVPKVAVIELQKVTLWFSPEYPAVPPRAEYHPGAGWLRDHGRDPAMVKGVEFTNVRIFAAETRRMPNFALHELAHAYHDQVLGNGHKELIAAFERAKAAGSYERVERQDSEGRKTMDRAYAMTSPQEYFAETTEAYFAKNDFQPYDREQLKAFDPAAFELLGVLWKCDR